MTRSPSPVAKAVHGSRTGTIRLDERARTPRLPSQSLVLIAPRPFAYDTLQPGEIRLIDISPSRDRSAPIRATVKHQPLQYGAYEALSPALESEEKRETILVNGQLVTVGGGLLEALRDIRRETESRTLWIDSICINQNDREEKGEQLRRITEIFGHATRVITWSGDKNGATTATDDAILNPWLTVGRTARPPIWKPALLQMDDLGSEHSFDANTSQRYFMSSPALTSSPGSPQTNSTSPAPGSLADFHFQAASSPDRLLLHQPESELWPGSLYDSDLHQLSSSNEILADISRTSQRKRSLVTAFKDDLLAPRNQKMQRTEFISADNNERESNVVFACPFQKSDPHKYHRCLKYTLNRIKDVKQHIYRQHTQPPYYCARCYMVFTTTDNRDEHARRADCEKRHPPQFEGISEEQKNELKKSSPRKKPLREQWFDIWDVVFPGRRRPQSVFIGNYVEEMVPLLRNLWNEKRAEIISGVIDSRGERNEVDSGLLADLMSSVFDRFEAEASRPSPGSGTERTGNPGTNSFQQTTQNDPDFCFELEAPFGQQKFSQIAVPDFDPVCAIDFGNFYSPIS